MARISNSKITKGLEDSIHTRNTTEQGTMLEDIVSYIFQKVPGVSENERNVFSQSRSQELDIIFWNKMLPNGMYFFPSILVVECKNWTSRVGGPEIDWFKNKLKRRWQQVGIVIARCGITGNSESRYGAHD